jgi:hypothetical protein
MRPVTKDDKVGGAPHGGFVKMPETPAQWDFQEIPRVFGTRKAGNYFT